MFPNREVYTCRFHDICLNHTSLEWQYYVDPEDVEVPLFYHYLNGHAVYEFPGDFVMTGHVHILPYTPWAPKVINVLSCGSLSVSKIKRAALFADRHAKVDAPSGCQDSTSLDTEAV